MRSAAAICLLTLALAGCGAAAKDSSKDFKGDERAVAAVVEDLETTARKDDEAKICTKLLTPALLGTLAKQGTNCKTAVREALKDADSFDLQVEDVTISGVAATVKVQSGAGSDKKIDTLTLKQDGAVWKIDSLGG